MLYRWSSKVYNKIPVFFHRTAFEWFTSILCLTVALVTFISNDIHSEAVDTQLPTWIVLTWYTSLTFGPILAMIGMVVKTQVVLSHVLFWIKVEAIGLVQISFVGTIFCIAMAAARGWNGFVGIMLITALVLTSIVRVLELYAEVDSVRRDLYAGY